MVELRQALVAAGAWLVHGDAIAQSLFCVSLLLAVRDALALRYRRAPEPAASDFPPVSILKPLHGEEPRVQGLLDGWCLLHYPRRRDSSGLPTPGAPPGSADSIDAATEAGSYEVLFALEDDRQPLYPIAAALADAYPDRVRCVLSGADRDAGVNGKSHNLAAAAAAARYDLLLISDSDTLAEPDVLRRLVAPLVDPLVALVAATPRVRAATGIPARLERLLVNNLLAPFELAAAQVSGARGLWGTQLLVRRSAIEAAGGFSALGRHLAEDIALEDAIRAQGLRGALVRRPVDVVCGEMTLPALLAHWQRWLVGLRRMRPLDYACMALILVAWLMPLGVLGSLMAAPGAMPERLTALGTFAAVAAGSLLWLGRGGVAVREPPSSLALLPLAIAVLLGAWCWSLVDSRVTWRGRRLHIGPGGRIVMPDAEADRAGRSGQRRR